MKKSQRLARKNWRLDGKAPDYRFSLANERTYLAWVRTALALLVGAVGIDQLTPELANPAIRIMLTSFLCLSSGLLAIFAYSRWAANERAMRQHEQLPYTGFLKLISITVLLLTVVVIFAINL